MLMRLPVAVLAWVAVRALDISCDWDAYATRYADVRAAFGRDETALRAHYVAHGRGEGRECAAFFNRTRCAELFTCAAPLAPPGPARVHFPALAGQREMYALAAALAAETGGRVEELRDALAAARERCLERLETVNLGAACGTPPRPAVLTVADTAVHDDGQTVVRDLVHFSLHGRDDGATCAAAARALEAFGRSLAWCLPGDRACATASIYALAGRSEVLAANRALREAALGAMRSAAPGAFALTLARPFAKITEEEKAPLHVVSLMFHRAGFSLLPQWLDYYTRRVPGVRFTLVDNDARVSTADGRYAWCDAYDVRVFRWDARVSRLSPETWAVARNALWAQLAQDFGDAAVWVAHVDLDEFLDVDGRRLRLWERAGVTIARGVGFHMVGASRNLQEVTRGLVEPSGNKVCLFRPGAVTQLHSARGNHDAHPQPMERLVWGILDLYHFHSPVPDPFGGLDDAFFNPDGPALWEDRTNCRSSNARRQWLLDRAAAVELLGGPLNGLEPFTAYNERGRIPANESCAFVPRSRSSLNSHDHVWGNRTWFWAKSHVGVQAHPPFLKSVRAAELRSAAGVGVVPRLAAPGDYTSPVGATALLESLPR